METVEKMLSGSLYSYLFCQMRAYIHFKKAYAPLSITDAGYFKIISVRNGEMHLCKKNKKKSWHMENMAAAINGAGYCI